MMSISKKVTIVIPTRNRPKEVINCLESVLAQSILPQEIVIVDGGDEYTLKEELNQLYLDKYNISLKYVNADVGTARARNIGADHAEGEYIFFLDDDVILDKDYIKEIVRVYEIYPKEKIGGVTGKVIHFGKEEIFRGGIAYHIFASIFLMGRYGNGRFQSSGSPTLIRPDTNQITECGFLFGCSMAFRKKVFCEFKSDEAFTGYSFGEDLDLAYRVSRKYTNYYNPLAKLIHTISWTARRDKYQISKAMVQNLFYIFRKNYPQDLKHKSAFWWSMIGFCILQTVRTLLRGRGSIRGLLAGVISILKQR